MRRPAPVLAAILTMLALPAFAQDAAPSLALELNTLAPSESGCRVTFLATNRLGVELKSSAFEFALFGAGGGIERLVSLDFKAMPVGKTKVLQFDLAGLACEGVSRVLVNDVAACDGEGVDPRACLDALSTSTQTTVEFGV